MTPTQVEAAMMGVRCENRKTHFTLKSQGESKEIKRVIISGKKEAYFIIRSYD